MPRDNPLEQRIRARLAGLGANGLLRTLREPAGIDLSSNDYLNLSKHPVLATRFIEGAVREGCGSTGSRLLRGERACFAEVERRFARFKGAEKALYFSTGYLANIGVLTTLAEAGDVIFSDRRNHASLIDGMRLSRARAAVFPHNDVAAAGAAACGFFRERGPLRRRRIAVQHGRGRGAACRVCGALPFLWRGSRRGRGARRGHLRRARQRVDGSGRRRSRGCVFPSIRLGKHSGSPARSSRGRPGPSSISFSARALSCFQPRLPRPWPMRWTRA